MSSLSSKQSRKLVAVLENAFVEALTAVAVEVVLTENGREPFLNAKTFMKDIECHPDLHKVIDKIMPRGKSGGTMGAAIIKDDDAWAEATDKLGIPRFDKRGMSSYFLLYLVALAYVKELDLSESKLDEVMQGRRGNSEALALEGQAHKVRGKSQKRTTKLFGVLAIVENQIPESPKGFRQRLAVWLWNKANGATKPDYIRARKAAEDFIAASASNMTITALAAE